MSHIKVQYVREACHVVGVLFFSFFFFSCFSYAVLHASSAPLSTVQPAAQDKPPVVAEWGSGVTPRHDPDTISKHVNQMVDVSILLCKKLCLSLPHYAIT